MFVSAPSLNDESERVARCMDLESRHFQSFQMHIFIFVRYTRLTRHSVVNVCRRCVCACVRECLGMCVCVCVCV